jgi:hypothetical protein
VVSAAVVERRGLDGSRLDGSEAYRGVCFFRAGIGLRPRGSGAALWPFPLGDSAVFQFLSCDGASGACSVGGKPRFLFPFLGG